MDIKNMSTIEKQRVLLRSYVTNAKLFNYSNPSFVKGDNVVTKSIFLNNLNHRVIPNLKIRRQIDQILSISAGQSIWTPMEILKEVEFIACGGDLDLVNWEFQTISSIQTQKFKLVLGGSNEFREGVELLEKSYRIDHDDLKNSITLAGIEIMYGGVSRFQQPLSTPLHEPYTMKVKAANYVTRRMDWTMLKGDLTIQNSIIKNKLLDDITLKLEGNSKPAVLVTLNGFSRNHKQIHLLSAIITDPIENDIKFAEIQESIFNGFPYKWRFSRYNFVGIEVFSMAYTAFTFQCINIRYDEAETVMNILKRLYDETGHSMDAAINNVNDSEPLKTVTSNAKKLCDMHIAQKRNILYDKMAVIMRQVMWGEGWSELPKSYTCRNIKGLRQFQLYQLLRKEYTTKQNYFGGGINEMNIISKMQVNINGYGEVTLPPCVCLSEYHDRKLRMNWVIIEALDKFDFPHFIYHMSLLINQWDLPVYTDSKLRANIRTVKNAEFMICKLINKELRESMASGFNGHYINEDPLFTQQTIDTVECVDSERHKNMVRRWCNYINSEKYKKLKFNQNKALKNRIKMYMTRTESDFKMRDGISADITSYIDLLDEMI